MNTVLETIIQRRSTRAYLDKAVEAAHLEAIIQAGLYAPSGGNHQYVRLFVLQGEKLKVLNSALVNAFLERELDPSQYQNKSAVRARQQNCDFFFGAQILISAMAPRNHPNSMADSANALQNMQIAAASLNLGACWINQPHWQTDHPSVRKIFEDMGLREDEDIFGSVIIGHPANEKQPPLPRKPGRVVF